MTMQTDAPLERLSLQISASPARQLTRMDLDVDTPYQRGPVWTQEQRQNLVRSLLRGLPIPAIVLNDRANPDWVARNGHPLDTDTPYSAVIDGHGSASRRSGPGSPETSRFPRPGSRPTRWTPPWTPPTGCTSPSTA